MFEHFGFSNTSFDLGKLKQIFESWPARWSGGTWQATKIFFKIKIFYPTVQWKLNCPNQNQFEYQPQSNGLVKLSPLCRSFSLAKYIYANYLLRKFICLVVGTKSPQHQRWVTPQNTFNNISRIQFQSLFQPSDEEMKNI